MLSINDFSRRVWASPPTGSIQLERRLFNTSRNNRSTDLGGAGDTDSDGKSTGSKTILLTHPSKHVASIELYQPKAKNAFGLDTARELIETFKELDGDQTVRCVVLSGHGADFTSGVDLKGFMSVYSKLQETEDIAHRAKLLRNTIEQYQEPFKRMYSFPKPIICVQHGLCLGLGIELAACSDIRFCSRDAKMAIREVLIGIAADVGSLQLLPRLVANQSLLNELLLTGRYMTPSEALDLGFVSRVCESKEAAMEAALEVARTISSRSPVAVQGSKQNIRFSRDKPFLVGLDYNAVWNATMMQGGDPVKAIGAILSKSEQVDYDDF